MSFWDLILSWFKKPAPGPLPLPVPVLTGPVTNVKMAFTPDVANFYSGCSIDNGVTYDLWATNGDRVGRQQSRDGVNWSNVKIVMTARLGTWESDGSTFLGSPTGISDPRVVKGATPGYVYTQYYTAGNAPNTDTKGGIGVAVSNDGDNWDRVGSGLLRTFPGGNCFILQAIKIAGKRYVYYLGGGDNAAGRGPDLMVMDDTGNGYQFTNDRILDKLPQSYHPLFYDEKAGSCWGVVGWHWDRNANPDGPTGFDLYRGGDGFTTMGEKIASVGPAITGNKVNFGPEALQRNADGCRSRPGLVNLLFASGNSWGTWRPGSVIINVP